MPSRSSQKPSRRATKSNSSLTDGGLPPIWPRLNGFLWLCGWASGCCGWALTFGGFHFVRKWPEIGPQSTPEAVDEAIALNKISQSRFGSEVEKASCEAWGVDFEDLSLHGILPYIATPLHSRGKDVLFWASGCFWRVLAIMGGPPSDR